MGLLALGAVLRLHAIGRHGFWLDEISSVVYARDLRLVADPATGHAPLYYALLSLWLHFGSSEGWVRTLSTVFGLTVVVAVYAVAREWFSTRAAVLASFFVTVSPVQVWASREARGFALMHLLGLVSVWAWSRARSGGRKAWWLLAGAAASAAMYTHYYALFVIAALLAGALIAGDSMDTSRLCGLVAMLLLAGLLFIPWLPKLIEGSRVLAGYAHEVNAYSTRSSFAAKSVLYLLCRSDPPHLLGAAAEALLPGQSFTWLSLAGLAALAWFAWRSAKRSGCARALGVWAALSTIPILLAVTANVIGDLFLSARYVAFTSAFLAVPAGLALSGLPSTVRWCVLTAALALSLLGVQPLYRNAPSEIREAILHIDDNAKPGDCVGTVSNKAFCYQFYSTRHLPAIDVPWEVPGVKRQIAKGAPLEQRAVRVEDVPALAAYFRTCGTAWVLYNDEQVWGVDMGAGLLRRGLLDAGLELVQTKRFADTRVEAYRGRVAAAK